MTTSVGGAVAAPSSSSRLAAARSVLNVAVFFCALIASCELVGRYLPFPTVPVVREKLQQLARYGDEYDVLFIGSSRMYFQVMPRVFDQVAREQGLPVRSYNAGVWAMMPPEDNYFLDQVLRCPHRRLRWVFLEMMPLNERSADYFKGTGRLAYWHDGERMGLLTKRFLRQCTDAFHNPKLPGGRFWGAIQDCREPLAAWLDNVGLFLENRSNIGRGETLIARVSRTSEKAKKHGHKVDEEWDGWVFPKGEVPLTGTPRVNYERQRERLLDAENPFDEGDAVSWAALQTKMARLTQAGVTPILVLPPTVATKRYFPPQLAGQDVTALDYSDPRKNPEFFAVENRLDWVHLSSAGSKLFTETLAQRFVEIAGKSDWKP